jgi:hypothetical protein
MKFVLLGLFLFSINLNANTSATSVGSGGTGRAVTEPGEALLFNPAALVFVRGYYFYSGYNTQDLQKSYSLGLYENLKETLFPTALVYEENSQDSVYKDKLFKVSLSNFISQNLSGGLSLKYLNSVYTDKSQSKGNLDFAMFWAPRREVGVSVVFDNLLQEKALTSTMLEQKISLGFSYNFLKFSRMRADLVSANGNNLAKPTVLLGVENFMNKWTLFRLGINRNFLLTENEYSVGLGVKLPRFWLNYAYAQQDRTPKTDQHAIDLTVPVW